MDKNIKIGVIVFILICSGFSIYSYDRADDGVKILNDDDFESNINYGGNSLMDYQGPVPIGYDLEHFRKTGETIMESEKRL